VKHNINVFQSSGDPRMVRRLVISPDAPCNLPDGSIILHSETFFDDSGDYLELWLSVPQQSELLRVQSVVTPASDPDVTLIEEDFENDEPYDDDDDDEPYDDDNEPLFRA
jgi:hypothetical protein